MLAHSAQPVPLQDPPWATAVDGDFGRLKATLEQAGGVFPGEIKEPAEHKKKLYKTIYIRNKTKHNHHRSTFHVSESISLDFRDLLYRAAN